jgi:hypothetical protein
MEMEEYNCYKEFFRHIEICEVIISKEDKSKLIISLKVFDKSFDCGVFLKSALTPIITKVIIQEKEMDADEFLNFILEILPRNIKFKSIEGKNFNYMFSNNIKKFLIRDLEKTSYESTNIRFIKTKLIKESFEMDLEMLIGGEQIKLIFEENPDQFDILQMNREGINLDLITRMVFDSLDKDKVRFLYDKFSIVETLEAWYILGNIIPRKFKESKEYKMLCLYNPEFKNKYNEIPKFRFDY